MVRNSWIVATADDRATSVGVGPRKVGGWASASITLRTAQGGISAPIELTAGGSTGWTGYGPAAHAYLRVPAGMRIETDTHADGSQTLHIVQDGTL